MNLFDIAFHSTILGSGVDHGYGYVGYELITAWQRAGHAVWWGHEECPIGFNFVQPHWYEQLNTINIGYTPWESSKIPESWITYMQKMDQIWTTSNFCRNIFETAGLENVKILGHGINKDHYPLINRELKSNEPFKFLHLGTAKRKGSKEVYDAFKTLFANDTNYLLVLRGEPYFNIDITNVVVINGMLEQQDLTKLYLKCHAMIYPSYGEGFGLIPWQAAATGMPTAVTNWSALADNSWAYCAKLDYELQEADYEPHIGLWAKPSHESIIEIMLSFTKEYDFWLQVAGWRGRKIHTYCSWDRIAQRSLKMMEDLL